jgi:hypothetical protein
MGTKQFLELWRFSVSMRRERGKRERGRRSEEKNRDCVGFCLVCYCAFCFVERECLASFCGSCLAVACFISVLNKKEKGIPWTDWFCSSETHLL